jgi:S1-C subfamily serine protease
MIKRIVAVAVAAVVSVAAFAGGSGEKCKYSTQECLDYMANKMKSGGWVGVELDKNEQGLLMVQKVVPGSPAEKAGIQTGDIFFALNGIEIANEKNQEALKKARADWKPGQTVGYTIKRNGTDHQISVTLGAMPADLLARYIGEHMMEHASPVEKAEASAK